MIDDEMRRLYQNHQAKSSQWEAGQRSNNAIPENYDFEAEFEYVEPATVQGFSSGVDRSISGPRRRKDEKMVEDDPMRYCADRCVSTGNCDVFEDMFDMVSLTNCTNIQQRTHFFEGYYQFLTKSLVILIAV